MIKRGYLFNTWISDLYALPTAETLLCDVTSSPSFDCFSSETSSKSSPTSSSGVVLSLFFLFSAILTSRAVMYKVHKSFTTPYHLADFFSRDVLRVHSANPVQ